LNQKIPIKERSHEIKKPRFEIPVTSAALKRLMVFSKSLEQPRKSKKKST